MAIKLDRFGRPLCGGYLWPGRCNAPVFLGYCRCPRCDRLYDNDQIKTALKHESGKQFRGWKGYKEKWQEICDEAS